MRDDTIALNRRARHEFTIEDTFEAGIVLTGTEIKRIRARKVSLSDAYARIEHGEAWLIGAHIAPWEQRQPVQPRAQARPASCSSIAPRSTSCSGKTKAKGLTIVPLRMYISPRPGEAGARARARQAAPRPTPGDRRPGRAA